MHIPQKCMGFVVHTNSRTHPYADHINQTQRRFPKKKKKSTHFLILRHLFNSFLYWVFFHLGYFTLFFSAQANFVTRHLTKTFSQFLLHNICQFLKKAPRFQILKYFIILSSNTWELVKTQAIGIAHDRHGLSINLWITSSFPLIIYHLQFIMYRVILKMVSFDNFRIFLVS